MITEGELVEIEQRARKLETLCEDGIWIAHLSEHERAQAVVVLDREIDRLRDDIRRLIAEHRESREFVA